MIFIGITLPKGKGNILYRFAGFDMTVFYQGNKHHSSNGIPQSGPSLKMQVIAYLYFGTDQ
jgi:hypothetical protein